MNLKFMAGTYGIHRAMTFAAAGLCVCIACRNPFFPPLGLPDAAKPLRTTPGGVITQLINAYEQMRIDRYEDLFPKSGTFQFYVSPRFAETSYSSRAYANPPEPRDTLLHYIGNESFYYYWNQERELQSHKKMFTVAISIAFKVKPDVDPGKFRYILNGSGDTTNVELEMTSGEFVVSVQLPNGVIDETPVAIEKQIFLLERDDENLWVIRKWYDLGSKD